MLIEKILLYSVAQKKGIEKNRATIEIKNEKSRALIENNVFFSETADAAENTAEIKVNKNQFTQLTY